MGSCASSIFKYTSKYVVKSEELDIPELNDSDHHLHGDAHLRCGAAPGRPSSTFERRLRTRGFAAPVQSPPAQTFLGGIRGTLGVVRF